MTDTDKLIEATRDAVEAFGMREGQALMTAAETLDPIFAKSIRGTQADPYHNDDNIDTFWKMYTGSKV